MSFFHYVGFLTTHQVFRLHYDCGGDFLSHHCGHHMIDGQVEVNLLYGHVFMQCHHIRPFVLIYPTVESLQIQCHCAVQFGNVTNAFNEEFTQLLVIQDSLIEICYDFKQLFISTNFLENTHLNKIKQLQQSHNFTHKSSSFSQILLETGDFIYSNQIRSDFKQYLSRLIVGFLFANEKKIFSRLEKRNVNKLIQIKYGYPFQNLSLIFLYYLIQLMKGLRSSLQRKNVIKKSRNKSELAHSNRYYHPLASEPKQMANRRHSIIHHSKPRVIETTIPLQKINTNILVYEELKSSEDSSSGQCSNDSESIEKFLPKLKLRGMKEQEPLKVVRIKAQKSQYVRIPKLPVKKTLKSVALGIIFIRRLKIEHQKKIKMRKQQMSKLSKQIGNIIIEITLQYYCFLLQEQLAEYCDLLKESAEETASTDSIISIILNMTNKLKKSTITKKFKQLGSYLASSKSFFPSDFLSQYEMQRLQFNPTYGYSENMNYQRAHLIIGLLIGVKIFCSYFLFRPWLVNNNFNFILKNYALYERTLHKFGYFFYFMIMDLMKDKEQVSELKSIQILSQFGIKPMPTINIFPKNQQYKAKSSLKCLFPQYSNNCFNQVKSINTRDLKRCYRNIKDWLNRVTILCLPISKPVKKQQDIKSEQVQPPKGPPQKIKFKEKLPQIRVYQSLNTIDTDQGDLLKSAAKNKRRYLYKKNI